ncbi:hypothetical protein ACHQM5_025381 [Ranunculus cassubicifolius]
MEEQQDNQQVCSSGSPVISRLDRLDRLLQQLEKRQIPSQENSNQRAIDDNKCKPISSALEEVHTKGTLMERLTMLENRVLQLCLAIEDGNTSSSSISMKSNADNAKEKSSAEWDGKLVNTLEKQEHTLQERVCQEPSKKGSQDQKKGKRRKKTSTFIHDKRRFGWFHMGC